MTVAVDHSWDRITAWLSDHAPGDCELPQSGARPSDITAVEREPGRELPADLVSWWRRANHMRIQHHHQMLLPTLYAPLSIAEAISRRRLWLQVADEVFSDLDPPGDFQRVRPGQGGGSCSG